MVQRCPACGARHPGSERCRRCGCELHGLTRLLAVARQAEREAVHGLLAGEISQAQRAAERAQALDRQGLGAALVGFLAWRGRQS